MRFRPRPSLSETNWPGALSKRNSGAAVPGGNTPSGEDGWVIQKPPDGCLSRTGAVFVVSHVCDGVAGLWFYPRHHVHVWPEFGHLCVELVQRPRGIHSISDDRNFEPGGAD